MQISTAQIYLIIIGISGALSSVILATLQVPAAADPKVCAGNPHDADSGPNGNPHDLKKNGDHEVGNPHDGPPIGHHEGLDICPGSR